MSNDHSLFHEVVKMADEYWVYDFSRGPQTDFECPFEYSVGKYDEHRPGMYTTPLFGGVRDLHVGIDLGGPVGTPIFAFADGVIHSLGVNDEAGSYGPTIITRHEVALPVTLGSSELAPIQTVWVLHGHLTATSLNGLEVGQVFHAGDRIAWIGAEHENGGWPPHLHIQLSISEPTVNDMPGVVELSQRDQALVTYPDPRLILGRLY
ncbi:MAG: peptidase M23 [Euryarchaeota archaeon]|nr:peptidase M23 [Euryarchaeota archaeon]|tara:strand:- start:55184 stop:55804 length:621 start_codon:yes stop_codon:yes gene_type:complete